MSEQTDAVVKRNEDVNKRMRSKRHLVDQGALEKAKKKKKENIIQGKGYFGAIKIS